MNWQNVCENAMGGLFGGLAVTGIIGVGGYMWKNRMPLPKVKGALPAPAPTAGKTATSVRDIGVGSIVTAVGLLLMTYGLSRCITVETMPVSLIISLPLWLIIGTFFQYLIIDVVRLSRTVPVAHIVLVAVGAILLNIATAAFVWVSASDPRSPAHPLVWVHR